MNVLRWFGGALLMVAAIAAPSATQAAGLLVADGGFGGRLKIIEQDVHVVVNNGIAVTTIDQVFLNTENRIVEALYTFPVPNGASVSNFSMVIGGKEMIGEVVEKERAREIYNSYKSKRRDPGLLEQVDYKTFELRVFPIAANAEQRISITYYQQLDFDYNEATYVYPLATNTKGQVDATTEGKFAFTIDVKSEIPITQLKSPSHEDDFVVTQPSENYRRASLEVSQGDLSRDVVISLDTERPRTGIDCITSNREGEDGYFMLTMTAGSELEELAVGMDYLFVVDISGSMADDGKLNLSRNAVNSFVGALGKEDRYDIITFNTTPQLQFGQLQAVEPEAREATVEHLLSQRARGGTSLRPAILTAYKFKDPDRPLNVVVLSDGMTEVREQAELLSAIDDAPSSTRVFCIGIGNEINRPLLQQVAEGAGGLAAFISHQDDFGRQAAAFRRKLMRPVATDVQISIANAGVYDVANEQLPDLYFGAPVRLYGRYGEPGLAQVTISASVLGQPMEQTVQLDFPELNPDNPEIERMWAFEKVERLMDQRRRGNRDSKLTQEIVRLCEGYSIVSEFASFIVLENDAEYARWSIERRNANRIQRDRAAQTRLRKELEKLRDEAVAQIGPADSKTVSANQSAPQSGPTPPSSNSSSPSSNSVTTPRDQTQPVPIDRTSRDLDIGFSNGGGHGGGAIDPITGFIAVSAAGAAAWARRRKDRMSK